MVQGRAANMVLRYRVHVSSSIYICATLHKKRAQNQYTVLGVYMGVCLENRCASILQLVRSTAQRVCDQGQAEKQIFEKLRLSAMIISQGNK